MSAESTVHALGIYKCPASLSNADFARKCSQVMEAILACPVPKRNILKYDLIIPNETLDEHLERLGMPTPKGTIVIIAEFPSFDALEEIAQLLKTPELGPILAGAREEFGFHIDSCSFAVDIVNMVK
ncbi:hypothetical protein DFH07DRAFT_776945 [Mycena maculata]|uniref:Uncharacterized protein n=1 Tax=Mycena maculata TaxID=230809 RepID=A0AAD7N406_9AGAR|nr:hypothetical protein DFH07DRAFT_776945 [Mycena maculata]